jgi:hypothetical protein
VTKKLDREARELLAGFVALDDFLHLDRFYGTISVFSQSPENIDR